jgi:hypothetical protein
MANKLSDQKAKEEANHLGLSTIDSDINLHKCKFEIGVGTAPRTLITVVDHHSFRLRLIGLRRLPHNM